MGSRYVDAVLFGLEGREFSLPWGKSGKDKKFGAQDMAFLLTVAARQPNPTTKRHGGLDPVCYGSPESMRSQMHLKKSAFFDTRQFLQALGLLSFSESEMRPDPKKGGAPSRFTNIYRINLARLREFFPNVKEWRKSVLHIDADEQLPPDVLQKLMALEEGECPVRNADKPARNDGGPVRIADSFVRNAESIVRNAENQVRITDSKTKDKSAEENHHPKQASGDVEKEYLDRVISMIGDRIEDRNEKINRNVITAAIKGKYADTVYNAIRSKKGLKRVGGYVQLLRSLPPKENDKAYQEAVNPTVGQILSHHTRETGYLVEMAMNIVGCSERWILDMLLPVMSRLSTSNEGRGKAMGVLDDFIGDPNETMRMKAKRLVDELNEKCPGSYY